MFTILQQSRSDFNFCNTQGWIRQFLLLYNLTHDIRSTTYYISIVVFNWNKNCFSIDSASIRISESVYIDWSARPFRTFVNWIVAWKIDMDFQITTSICNNWLIHPPTNWLKHSLTTNKVSTWSHSLTHLTYLILVFELLSLWDFLSSI